MIYKDVAKNIEKLRKKLHNSIKKNGIDSEITIEISRKLDDAINEYFKRDK